MILPRYQRLHPKSLGSDIKSMKSEENTIFDAAYLCFEACGGDRFVITVSTPSTLPWLASNANGVIMSQLKI
jgi:hypothetical protein